MYPGACLLPLLLLKHLALLNSLLGCETKPRLHHAVSGEHLRHILSHRRPMLEPVPGSAANEPNVFKLRMLIDQEIAV